MNPYLLKGPALISFSGGRTSAYLLWHILDAHGGQLPADVHVCFANTGKERPETLDFVQECANRWGVYVTWLEYDEAAPHKTRIVSHNSASRDGRPFGEVVRARGFLPNPVSRFCTTELKIRRMKVFMQQIQGYERWLNVIGLRADEIKRVAARLAANEKAKEVWTNVCPLASATASSVVHGPGLTKADIAAWWAGQSFDLRLPNVGGVTPAGNCDFCYLKGPRVLRRLMHEDPAGGVWWAELERRCGSLFRTDREDYDTMLLNAVLEQPAGRGMATDEEIGLEPSIDCTCTD